MIEYTVQVYPDGEKLWYLNGELHREDGPAVAWSDGTKHWYLNGKHHREDGPASELPSGTNLWYLHGEYHRENGPAIEYSDGTKEWWLNGKQVTEEEHRQQTQPQPTCDGKTVEIDGKTYVLTLKEN